MSCVTVKERFWATLAHVPIITIVWAGYLFYYYCKSQQFLNYDSIVQTMCSTNNNVPLTPIIFTLLSIPISLCIMWMKKKSKFIFKNAHQAYCFNIWLLKHYAALLFISIIGVVTGYIVIPLITQIIGLVLSLICLIQSCMGISYTIRGFEYRYWYPSELLFHS